jgi:FkbM family methyltransferase
MTVRDALAAAARRLPSFRGKARACKVVQDLLTDYADPAALVVDFRLKDGSRVRADLRSRTEWPTFWTGEYDPDLVRMLCDWVTPGCTFLDVGANVGYYTVPVGRRAAAAGGRVHAFEPSPPNADRVAGLVAANGLESTVTLHRFGLGEADAEAGIAVGADDRGATGNAYLTADPGGTRVRVRVLDAVAAECGIDRCDLMKVDVEGYELGVFRGGRGLITRSRPVIVTELNHYWMAERGWRLTDLTAFFDPLGYVLLRRSGRRFAEDPDRPVGVEDAILVPAEKRKMVR